MGIVYKAEDTKLHRKVALKFLPPELTRNQEAKERFIKEAQTASSLQHNNICTIHDIDETEDKQIFISMDMYSGETLKKKIEQGPLKLEEAIDISIQVLQGLQKAHEEGIVHRDIKPANIFITNDGIVKILDFGLAKLTGSSVLTKVGETLGTTAYMSPEQARGEDIDKRTDIWSLGVVLYEMITGKQPFKGEYEQAVIYTILNEEPEPVTGLRTNIPVEIERIICKTLRKHRGDRYQHEDEIIIDLKRLLQDTGSPAGRKSKTSVVGGKTFFNKNRKYFIPAAALLILAVTYFLIFPLLTEDVFIQEPTPIAVISFENQTGNEAFDYLQKAIPNLLITNLEQSKYFRVTTWERMQDILDQMGKSDIKVINKDIGFDICRREGVDIIVIGSYVKAGNMFATDIKVLDVATKQIIKSAGSRGEGIGSILESQIDDLSKQISQGIGISYAKISAERMKIVDVTTNSMEAYRYFLKGKDNLDRFYLNDAKNNLEAAVNIDSSFATAYLYLSLTNHFLQNKQAKIEAIKKAYRHSSKATEKEKLRINSYYASMVENNSEKGIKILNEMAEKYPREKATYLEIGMHYGKKNMYNEAIEALNKALVLDPNYAVAVNYIAYMYSNTGNYKKAIDYLKQYAVLNPEDANPFDSMADFYWLTGDIELAIENYKKALDVKPDFIISASKLGYLSMEKEEYEEAQRWAHRSIESESSSGLKAIFIWLRAFINIYQGKIKEAEIDLDKGRQLAKNVDNKYLLAGCDWLQAYVSYEKGDLSKVDKYYAGWLDYNRKYSPKDTTAALMDYKFLTALVNIKEKKLDSAKIKFREIKSFLPDFGNNSLYSSRYNILYAEILLAGKSTAEAINILKNAVPQQVPQLDYNTIVLYNTPFLKDILARAYVQAGQLDKAISEYERLIKFNAKGKDRYLIHPKYYYRLARLYQKQGLKEHAVTAYKRFLELWKEADSDHFELSDARSQLNKLLQ